MAISGAAAATLAITAISAGIAVAGAVTAAKGQQNQAKALKRKAAIDLEDMRRDNSRKLASQRVAFAGGGVDLAVGTPLDVAGDAASELELAALRSRFVARSQAAVASRRGQEALLGGILSGAGTVLGGGLEAWKINQPGGVVSSSRPWAGFNTVRSGNTSTTIPLGGGPP